MAEAVNKTFAIAENGKIDVSTVGPTERSAKVNWLKSGLDWTENDGPVFRAASAALSVVQPELDRLRAENARMRSAGIDALTVLKFAFNRIHVLPRSRDTELANDIDKVLGRLRAALDGGEDA